MNSIFVFIYGSATIRQCTIISTLAMEYFARKDREIFQDTDKRVPGGCGSKSEEKDPRCCKQDWMSRSAI